jgi:hypothetical protein
VIAKPEKTTTEHLPLLPQQIFKVITVEYQHQQRRRLVDLRNVLELLLAAHLRRPPSYLGSEEEEGERERERG